MSAVRSRCSLAPNSDWGSRLQSLRHVGCAIATSIALAACTSSNPVDLEARTISVRPNAVPMAGGEDVVTHLLPTVGPSYVTLNVKEMAQIEASSNTSLRAITSGSGYVVDDSGIVMTAAHVAVKQGNAIQARAGNGRVYSGKVIAIKPTNDIAIIKLRGFKGRSVNPAPPGCLSPNSIVFTLGRPHAQTDTARVGELEGRHFGRAVAYGNFGYPDALVLRMATEKGESGGPLFDQNGKFIGMVVSTLTDANGTSINLAHAVPSTAIANFLCESYDCQPVWRALAQQTVDTCPNMANQ